MKISVILLAAGQGLRLHSKISKPLIKIGNIPLIIYSLRLFSRQARVKEIIVVVNKDNESGIIRAVAKFGVKKVKCFVYGGALRQDSVKNGLAKVSAETNLVLIHDAGRPFVKKVYLNSVIEKAGTAGAAILAVPVKATIKKCKVKSVKCKIVVKETLDRKCLWEAQTPQVFGKKLLLKAYAKFGKINVTDDSALVEKLGVKVSVVLGSYGNIKITTPEDLAVVEVIAKKWSSV